MTSEASLLPTDLKDIIRQCIEAGEKCFQLSLGTGTARKFDSHVNQNMHR